MKPALANNKRPSGGRATGGALLAGGAALLLVVVCATIQLDKTADLFIRTGAGVAEAAGGGAGTAYTSKCPAERDRQMDACAVRMSFLGDHSFRIPANVNAMQSFCADLRDSIQCIQSYVKDCVQGFTRQIVGGIMKRGKQQYSSICSSDSNKKNFLNKMSCLNGNKIGKFHSVMDASVARFEHIDSDQVKPDDKLLALCCSYQVCQRDVDTTMYKVCGSRDHSTKDFIKKIANSAGGEFYNLICEGHRSIDECRASDKTAQALAQFEDITAKVHDNKLSPKAKSMIPVLMRILSKSTTP